MHDGSLPTLEAVVRFYVAGGAANVELDPLISPLDLDEGEIEALIAFLETLTGESVHQLVSDALATPIGGG